MSGGSFESSQRTEPVCATRFSSIKNCFKTQASGLARGRGWSRIGQCGQDTRRKAVRDVRTVNRTPLGKTRTGTNAKGAQALCNVPN